LDLAKIKNKKTSIGGNFFFLDPRSIFFNFLIFLAEGIVIAPKKAKFQKPLNTYQIGTLLRDSENKHLVNTKFVIDELLSYLAYFCQLFRILASYLSEVLNTYILVNFKRDSET
jgi:hypothetical protein